MSGKLIAMASVMALLGCGHKETVVVNDAEYDRVAAEYDKNEAAEPAPMAESQKPVEIEASLKVVEGSPAQKIYLLPVGDAAQRVKMAESMRESGFACSTVSNIYKVRQEDGRIIDIMKIDCDTGSYQTTMLNDRVFIKPWDGYLVKR